MPGLVPHRDIRRCDPLLTLPMGGTSSLDRPTVPFESGMPILVLQSAMLLPRPSMDISNIIDRNLTDAMSIAYKYMVLSSLYLPFAT